MKLFIIFTMAAGKVFTYMNRSASVQTGRARFPILIISRTPGLNRGTQIHIKSLLFELKTYLSVRIIVEHDCMTIIACVHINKKC